MVLWQFSLSGAALEFCLLTVLPLSLQHSRTYPWLSPLAAIALVIRAFVPLLGRTPVASSLTGEHKNIEM